MKKTMNFLIKSNGKKFFFFISLVLISFILITAGCKHKSIATNKPLEESGNSEVASSINAVTIKLASSANGKITLSVSAAEADKAGLWVDLNGNGKRDLAEETITLSGDYDEDRRECILKPEAGNTLRIYGNITELHCYEAEVMELDVGGASELVELECQLNQIEKLDLTNNKKLKKVFCWSNAINEENMKNLVESLPKREASDRGSFRIFNTDAGTTEYNVCKKAHVNIAKGKNWHAKNQNGDGYAGSN